MSLQIYSHMQFVRFDGTAIGLLTDNGGIIDLTDEFDFTTEDPLKEFIDKGIDIDDYADAEPTVDLEDVRLESPIDRPGKVIAAPLNYENHIEESIVDEDITADEWFSIEDRGYFLKAPSSVVGPDHGVELPFSDRRVDHEIELAFVMGEDVKDASRDEAWDAIFGYTIVLDITVRGDQDRSNRKSYDTFTVVGPAVVTADEVGDPQDLEMQLDLNGETKQEENTADMIYNCAQVVQYASIGTTIEAGDVVTTGTPEGVGPINDGDTIEAWIENIGSMNVDVEARDMQFCDTDIVANSN
jgi:2-keto-4-pentenoate hydratase/2-oxohepta-3-ene-1,7-dioic acid hydratase in catechol pathway